MRRRVLLGLGLLLLVGSAATVIRFNGKAENKVSEIVSPTPPREIEDQPEFQPTRPVFSPNGKYLAYLWGYQSENNWNILFVVAGQDSKYQIDWSGVEFLKEGWTLTNWRDANEIGNQFVTGWNRDGKKLAMVIKDKFYLWEFESSEKGLRAIQQISTSVRAFQQLTSLSFMNDDSVVVTTNKEIKQVYPAEKTIWKGDEKSGNVWPLPAGNGYIYWQQLEKYGAHDLIMIKDGNQTRYKTPFDGGVDAATTILLSPDLKYACVESSSSGYHGYSIFKLGSQKEIFDGQQYSWCERWLDNKNIVVREFPYEHQSNAQFFMLNVYSGSKTLIGDYVESNGLK